MPLGGDFIGNAAVDLIGGDVFFDGPNATAANGGNPIPIFTPNPFVLGASLSHPSLTSGAFMGTAAASGVANRQYTALDLGILADLGWTVIPEPSSMSLLALAGLILLDRRNGKAGR